MKPSPSIGTSFPRDPPGRPPFRVYSTFPWSIHSRVPWPAQPGQLPFPTRAPSTELPSSQVTLWAPPSSLTVPSRLLSRARLGLTKRHSAAFRSPVPIPKSGQADETNEDSLQLEIQELKQKRDTLDQEISQLMAEGYVVSELEDHISLLHEYNDIKDVGQMLMGKLASIRGVTTKELYPEFDLDMDD